MTLDFFMTLEAIYISIILLVIVITWRLNKRFDDDPVKDFLRIIAAIFATLGVLFFWNWL